MKTSKIRVPMRYVPRALSRNDRRTQIAMLKRSRRLYKRGKYYGRTTKLKSYPHVASKHTDVARRMYNMKKIVPNAALAAATQCSVAALNQLVKKGEGAFYSSGYARLASAITGGKAAAVDYAILKHGCKSTSKALRLARTVKKGAARKISI